MFIQENAFVNVPCNMAAILFWPRCVNINKTKHNKIVWDYSVYSALPISRGHFSPNNSRKTSIGRPLGWAMCVFREFEVLSKFYTRSCCAGRNFMFYCTAIYRESIVFLWVEYRQYCCELLTKARTCSDVGKIFLRIFNSVMCNFVYGDIYQCK